MSEETITQDNYFKGAIEALLFVNEKPVTLDQIKDVLEDLNASQVKKLIQQIRQEYERDGRGVVVQEIAGGYQMMSHPQFAGHIRRFYKTKHKERLSKPALETLAIVAYKQPVTRLDVELIRGVNSDGVVSHLIDKELIKIIGRKDVPGRPFLYGTTKQFLQCFGLSSLEDLPKMEEFSALESKMEEESESAQPPVDQPTTEKSVEETKDA